MDAPVVAVDGSEMLSLGDRIAQNYYPFALGHTLPYQPMPTAPPIGLLHPDVRALMQQCFELGHANPAIRPRAATWQQVLDTAESNLRLCRANTQHFYRFGLAVCPWCERMQMLGGWDPFPSRKAIQREEHLQPVISRAIENLVIDPYAGQQATPEAAPPADNDPAEGGG